MAPQQQHHRQHDTNTTPTPTTANGHHHHHHHNRALQSSSSSYEHHHHQQQAAPLTTTTTAPSLTEIMYTVDHLATFTVGESYGLLYPTDGLRRLRQMERTSGIWTQRMYLRIETLTVVMIDFESNETVERFPLQLVHEPSAFLSDDPAELYNNILVFTVASEVAAGRSPTEMHLFHCLRASADRVADELRYAIRRAREKLGLYRPPAPSSTGPSALPPAASASSSSAHSYANNNSVPPPPPMPPTRNGHHHSSRQHHSNSNIKQQRTTTAARQRRQATIDEDDEIQQQQQQQNGQKPKTLGVSVKETVKELNNVIAARRYRPIGSPAAAVSPVINNGNNSRHSAFTTTNGNNNIPTTSSRYNNLNVPPQRRHHHHHHHHNHRARSDETADNSDQSSHHSDLMRRFNAAAAARRRTAAPAVVDTTNGSTTLSDDDYEREVHVLNRCFDDIESFVARLQIAYASRDELERRRRFGKQQQDAAKSSKKSAHNNKKADTSTTASIVSEQILLQRAQLPPERDFVDILQKFKLSFNLLAKLKGQIHDPNSPELVHFLFTPLAMIVDAVQHASLLLPPHEWPAPPDLAQRVLSPLLKRDTVHLLQNCLTSKEFDLWKSLGEAWSIPHESWRGPAVPPYRPVFYSGWEPYGSPSDDWRHPSHDAAADNTEQQLERITLPPLGVDPYQWLLSRESERIVITTTAEQEPQPAESVEERAARVALADVEKRQRHWVDELETIGARMVHVVYPRAGANEKELSAQRGEVLQVLDASRNWWKLKNWRGDTGFAPHTILAPYPPLGVAH